MSLCLWFVLAVRRSGRIFLEPYTSIIKNHLRDESRTLRFWCPDDILYISPESIARIFRHLSSGLVTYRYTFIWLVYHI